MTDQTTLHEASAEALFKARFNAHYGLRVVCRQARLYRGMSRTVLFLSLLFGGGAITAVVAQNAGLSTVLAVMLAAVQALAVAVSPVERAVKAEIAASRYRKVVNGPATEGDVSALKAAYRVAADADETPDVDWLRPLAYNDACDELGVAAEHKMPLPVAARWLGWLA